jgi:pSer/pThr/pTyr-binding forkhead associated (FHA) protein/thioredoxin reductase/ferredoxin
VELTNLERAGDLWQVIGWNHNTKTEQRYKARHVVLAFGRGVPRRLDVAGDVAGLAFGLTDATKYVGEPALVIGGGTSAGEAVIAISNAKVTAGDPSGVYWSYRGEKMPKVSKALADVFFEAFVGNGNVRYLAKSEPTAVVDIEGHGYLCIRTARQQASGSPAETTQLEFRKVFCIACIGEDIPEGMLNRIGVPLVTGGPQAKKRLCVSPLLETRQPNLYLAGDVLSPAYLETTDFDGDPGAFTEVKRRGNVKAALRDGVLVAEVIAQKLAGRREINVQLKFVEDGGAEAAPAAAPGPVGGDDLGLTLAMPSPAAAPPPAQQPAAAAKGDCVLVAVLQTGVEANEYPVKRDGVTTIGRIGVDIAFPDDPTVSDRHASVAREADGYYVRDEGSARGVYLRPTPEHDIPIAGPTLIRIGRQWLLAGDPHAPQTVAHIGPGGQVLQRYPLKDGTTIIGREAPDVTIAPDDRALSRRHVVFIRKAGHLIARDLGSANGTLVKVGQPMRLGDGDHLIIGQQTLRVVDERTATRPKTEIRVRTAEVHAEVARAAMAAASAPVPAPAPAPRPAPAPPPAAARPTPAPAPAPAPAPPRPAPAPAPAAPAAAGPAGPAVQVAGQNWIPCEQGKSICAVLEGAKVKIDADCHQGVCGMDPVRIISGGEHLSAMNDAEKGTLEDLCSLEPGAHRLACMARVMGPVSVEIIKQ